MITGVLFALLILMLVAILKSGKGDHLPGARPDWTEKVSRPCCKNCAYWMPYDVLVEGGKPIQFCEKQKKYTDYDFCCLDYCCDETEVGNGYDSDPV